MSGRKNKLCNQKGQGAKGVRLAKKLTKRNPTAGQKDHFKCIWPAKNKLKKRKTILNYKFESVLNFGIQNLENLFQKNF